MSLKGFLALLILLAVCATSGFVGFKYYSYIFAKDVKGEVLRVERVSTAEMIIATPKVPAAQLFSFAVAIRDEKGEIHTASSEDRQWALVSAGQCAQAKFFPYPPWQLDKAHTYFGARLERLFDCGSTPAKEPEPKKSPTPVAPSDSGV